MDFLNGNTFPSSCSEGGFELQKHLMLYCCAKLRKMECQKFSVGYEVEQFTKFDDIVCHFELNGKNYLIPMQSKFVQKDEKQINESDFMTKKGRINLKKHIQGIMDFLKDIQGFEVRFIIVTTASLNVNMRNIRFKSVEMEENQPIMNISNLLIESGAKISQIDLQFGGFKEILQQLQVDLNIPKSTLYYIIDRLFFITKVPKEEKLLQIIKDLLVDVDVVNRRPFFQIIQSCTTNYVEFDKITKKRKVISKHVFDTILRSSVLEADLQGISDSFLSEIKLSIEFESQFLKESWEKLRNAFKFIKCERNENLTALRVLHSIKMAHEDAILVPISKLNDFHIECLKFYDENERNIVVLVDKEMQQNDLVEKTNIYYVGKIKVPELPSFSYDELTRKAKRAFKENVIKIQDFELKLKQIPNNESNEHKALMEKFFGFFCDKKAVKIGKTMPVNSHPYIERDFQKDSDPQNKMKVDIFKTMSLCIVKGQPGLGKSFTLKQMANLFKRNNSEYWVEFIELNLHGRHFGQKREFTAKQAKDFLLDNLLSFQKDSSLDRELVEYYLTLECPPITLIFDGFDEIMPSYEEVVFNFIQKLVELKVKVVISGRPHSEKVLKDLKNFEKIQICEYSDDQQKSFIQKYYAYKIESCQSMKQRPNEETFSSFSKIMENMIKNSEKLDKFPLYLRMFCDIAFHILENSENYERILKDSNQIDIVWIYNEIFELSFENYLREKEGVDPTTNLVIQRSQRIKKNLKLFYSHVAAKEIEMEIVLPHFQELSETEILGPGFLRKMNNLNCSNVDQFVFIHRTFAEYFLAEKLVDCLESYIDIFRNTLNEYWKFLEILKFLCPLLVNKIKEKKIIVIPNENCEKRELFLKFFSSISKYCWDYDLLENFKTIIEFLWDNFAEDGLKFYNHEKSFLWYPRVNLETIVMKSELAYKFRNDEFSYCKLFEEFSRTFEKDLIFVLATTLGFETFKEVYNIVKKYCNSFKEFTEMLIKEMVEEWKNDPYWSRTCDIFFWCIWTNFNNSEDPKGFLTETVELLNNSKMNQNHKETCDFIVSILRKSKRDKSLTFEEYLRDICHVLSSDDICKFLKVFDRNYTFVYNEGFTNFIEIFKKNPQKLILSDNNSILYHFCIEKLVFQIFDLIKNISDEHFTLLTESPHFGGKSFEEYYQESGKEEWLDMLYCWYIYKLHLNQINNLLSKYGNDTNISEAIKKDFTLFTTLALYVKDENVKNIVTTFCQNNLNWERESGTNTNFLHCLAKTNKPLTISEEYYPIKKREFELYEWILHIIFKYLKEIKSQEGNEENLLLEKLFERDNDGNIPLQICALERNYSFFDVVLEFSGEQLWYDMFSRKNNRNQNFFHCLGARKLYWPFGGSRKYINSFKSSYKPSYDKLFLETDIDGRTPFHSFDNFEYPFTNWLTRVSNETFSNLLQIIDKDGNNILHYMAKHDYHCYNRILPLKYHIEVSPLSHELIKKALKWKNNSNKTPIDVLEDYSYCIDCIEKKDCRMKEEFSNILKQIEEYERKNNVC